MLLGADAARAQDGPRPSTQRRAEASEIVAPGLGQRLLQGELSEGEVRGWLEEFAPHLGADDELAARVVVSCATALHALLTSRDEGVEERLELEELLTHAFLDLGDHGSAAQQAYLLEGRLRERGEFRRAETLVGEILAALPPDHALRPFLLLARAETARHFGEVESARDLLFEATELSGADPMYATLALAILGLRAQIHLDCGLTDLAAPLIRAEIEGLRERQELGDENPGALLAAHLRQANLRLATGRYALLRVELERALEEIEEYADPLGRVPRTRQQLELRLAIARVEEGLDDPALVEPAREALAAILASETADELTRLGCECRLGQLALQQAQPERAQRWLADARARVAARTAADFPVKERAFLSALELRLALVRGEAADVQRARLARLEAEVEELVDEWRAQPPRLGGLGFLRYDRTRVLLGELMAGHAALEGSPQGAERALLALRRARDTGSLHRRLGASQPGLAEVRRALLPEGTGALIYLPFRDRSYVLTLDAKHVEMHELVSERTLEDLARRWMAQVMTSPVELSRTARVSRRAGLASQGAQLSALLLPESVRARLRAWSALHVVGSDLLGELPLEALPLPDGRALGLAKAVGYLPSLSIGVHLAGRVRSRSREIRTDLCLVAGVRSSPHADGLADLPFGRAELEPLVRPFEAARVATLLGPDATLAALRELDLGRTALLHLVTHGAHDPTRERPQGVRLSAGDTLWCEDAERLRAPALVVLSACSAGLGPRRAGEGPVSNLAGAFLFAGADTVVSSNAELAYRPTLELMAAFQRELAEGVAPAEALRRSRLELAASPETDDPFYHGLVRVLGLSQRPLF